MTDAAALEQEAQRAWREHCERIRLWVAQGHVGAEAGTAACEDRGKEVWMRAYVRLRRRTTGLGHLEGLDELDGLL